MTGSNEAGKTLATGTITTGSVALLSHGWVKIVATLLLVLAIGGTIAVISSSTIRHFITRK